MNLPKQIRLVFPFIVCLLLGVVPLSSQSTRVGINTVVIDAGHGGKDPGAVGGGAREKDINLAVALRLGELIGEHYPGVKVIFTRKTDVFVDLSARADKANKAAADLFISIHTDAAKSSTASGSSTYVMGMDKAGKNLDIAMRENDVIVYEDDYATKYQGYTPGSTESFIIFSLMQYSFQEQSTTLASLVQQQYGRNTTFVNRGVKQGPFLVLWYAAMPSILTELGFISNESDRRTLTSKSGQEKMARSLFNAFSEYKVKTEGKGQLIALGGEGIADDPAPAETASASAATAESSAPGAPAEKICYRVQVMSSPVKVARNSSRFGIYRGEVTELKIGNVYKYYVGEVASYQEALSLQATVRQQIKDAFVAAFAGESPLSIKEARQRE